MNLSLNFAHIAQLGTFSSLTLGSTFDSIGSEAGKTPATAVHL